MEKGTPAALFSERQESLRKTGFIRPGDVDLPWVAAEENDSRSAFTEPEGRGSRFFFAASGKGMPVASAPGVAFRLRVW